MSAPVIFRHVTGFADGRSEFCQNNAMLIALCLFLVASVGLVWWMRRDSPASHDDAPEPANGSPDFHAVTIILDGSPCAAVQRIVGQRYLSDAAPRFPLPECDTADCTCRYEHHEDRRDSGDRRDIWVAAGSSQALAEWGQVPRLRKDRRTGYLEHKP
jgi:hypothetical protein